MRATLLSFWSVLGNPSLSLDTLLGWNVSFIGKKHKKVWTVGPLCIFWSIWKVRNVITFHTKPYCPSTLVKFID